MKKALALCAVLVAASAFAQTYPTKPIHLIVPFPPGGASDLTARTIGQKMSEGLGQSVVVDNKPGANGVARDRPGREVARRRLHAPPHRPRLAHGESVAVRRSCRTTP